MTDGVSPPTSTRPFIFGIIDARHSCDHRFWTSVLPAFHELHANTEVTFDPEIAYTHSPTARSPRIPSFQVKFDPEICLAQVAHSYIGMEHATDKLDMRNDFLFTGMVHNRTCLGHRAPLTRAAPQLSPRCFLHRPWCATAATG